MKILMLSTTFPYPPSRGGTQVRTFNFVKHLSQEHEVTLLVQRAKDVTDSEIETLDSFVKALVVFPTALDVKTGILKKLQRYQHFWQSGTPPNVSSHYSEAMQQWIDQAVEKQHFDVISCEHSINEVYIRPEWKQPRTVINCHSSIYRTCQNQLDTNTSENIWRDRLYLPLLRRYEQNISKKFSHLVVTTEEDQNQYRSFNPKAQITVIPNGVDLELFPYRQADPGGYELIVTGGMDYMINIDAACFFSLEVLPILQRNYPRTRLKIVGANPSPKVLSLQERPDITVTGRVPSMAEYLHQATVCIVPMRSGFGIKNKTLEAMACGVPIVASDRGLEGLNVDHSALPLRALRANHIEEYVAAISRLFEDEVLRQKLSQNARSYIEEEYRWESLAKIYEQVLMPSETDKF